MYVCIYIYIYIVTLSYHNVFVKFFSVIENGFAIILHMVLSKLGVLSIAWQRLPPKPKIITGCSFWVSAFLRALIVRTAC